MEVRLVKRAAAGRQQTMSPNLCILEPLKYTSTGLCNAAGHDCYFSLSSRNTEFIRQLSEACVGYFNTNPLLAP